MIGMDGGISTRGGLLTCFYPKKDDTAFWNNTFLALIDTAAQSLKWRPCRLDDNECGTQFPARDEEEVAPVKCPQIPLVNGHQLLFP